MGLEPGFFRTVEQYWASTACDVMIDDFLQEENKNMLSTFLTSHCQAQKSFFFLKMHLFLFFSQRIRDPKNTDFFLRYNRNVTPAVGRTCFGNLRRKVFYAFVRWQDKSRKNHPQCSGRDKPIFFRSDHPEASKALAEEIYLCSINNRCYFFKAFITTPGIFRSLHSL